jgi:hypothetical protein
MIKNSFKNSTKSVIAAVLSVPMPATYRFVRTQKHVEPLPNARIYYAVSHSGEILFQNSKIYVKLYATPRKNGCRVIKNELKNRRLS